ncbi:MAG: domain S-box-containing protein [Belnapia sp.]|nr:domain S-box-containing protein [Belnapia sp.]
MVRIRAEDAFPPSVSLAASLAASAGNAQAGISAVGAPTSGRVGASFRLHLIGILLAALVPACLVAGFAVHQEVNAFRTEWRRGLEGSARSLGLTLNAAIDARIGLAATLAAMAANGSGPPVFDSRLRDVAARLGTAVFAYGPPPAIAPLVNTNQPSGFPLPLAELGRGPTEAVARVFGEAGPQVGDIWPGTSPSGWVGAAFAPVFRNDEVAAAIAVGIDMPVLQHLLQGHQLRPGSVAMLVDGVGRIVARSEGLLLGIGEAMPDWIRPNLPAEMLPARSLAVSRPAGIEAPDVTGVHVAVAPAKGMPAADGGGLAPQMVAVAQLARAPGWLLVICQPPAGYAAAFSRPALPLAAAAVCSLGVGAWLALLLARRCLRPIAVLTTRAAAIAAGRLPDPEQPSSEVREFTLLSMSLTAAQAALECQAAAAQQGLDLLQSVIDGTPDAMLVQGPDGRVVVANAAADRAFALPRGGLVGRYPPALLPPDLAVQIAAHDAGIRCDGGPVTRDYRTGPPGHRQLLVTKAALPGPEPGPEPGPKSGPKSGQVAGIITLIQDVTAQRRTEAELRRAEGEMQRLGRRATAGAMASGLAHELNQPLTAATNYLRAAERLLDTETSPERLPVLREAVRAAAEQTLRAGEIIRRLRDFVTRRDIAPVLEPLAAVIGEGVRLGLGPLHPSGLLFRSEMPADLREVMVDRLAVQQVLVNLLRNAVEAMQGHDRQELIVSAALREEDGQRLLDIRVADTGPGLSREVLDRLFEPFVSTKPDGMGVGLAICRRIAESQGGTITVAAGKERGAVFTLSLPLPDATAAGRSA